MIPCAAQALLFQQLRQRFSISLESIEDIILIDDPIDHKVILEPSVYIMLHIWLLQKCNDCEKFWIIAFHFIWLMIWEQSLLSHSSSQRFTPALNSCEMATQRIGHCGQATLAKMLH